MSRNWLQTTEVKRTLQRQKKEVGPRVFPLRSAHGWGDPEACWSVFQAPGITGPHVEAPQRELRLEDEPQIGLLT